MRNGTVLRARAGEFLLLTEEEKKVIEAVARGKLKKEGIKIYPGDFVQFVTEDELPVIEKVYPRKNLLFRPKVANIDELVIVASIRDPKPDFLFLDKILALSEWFQLPATICINKIDLNGQQSKEIREIYEPLGYSVLDTSALLNQGIDEFREKVAGKTVVLIGLTGAGKSTLLNSMNPDWKLKTGEVSRKLRRGRHTTKHVEFLPWEKGLISDTPGFSKLDIHLISGPDLPYTFVEFIEYQENCRFTSCLHFKEPGCGVKNALENGQIAQSRYDNYLRLLKELGENETS